jgi:hypothetical protein
MSSWISSSDLTIFFVGFMVYNFLSRELKHIEKILLSMKDELGELRKTTQILTRTVNSIDGTS